MRRSAFLPTSYPYSNIGKRITGARRDVGDLATGPKAAKAAALAGVSPL